MKINYEHSGLLSNGHTNRPISITDEAQWAGC